MDDTARTGTVRAKRGQFRLAQYYWRRTRSLVRAKAYGAFWRLWNRPEPLSPDALVTFAIPLIGRASASDWEMVNTRLAATLASLLRQTDPRWEALICGQDSPDAMPDDPRCHFVRYPVAADPGTVTDKYWKIPFILGSLSKSPPRDGYLFLLDADDILHPGLVEHMMSRRARGGYLIDKGYMLDASSGDMAYLGPPDESHPGTSRFHLHCGSCSAIRSDRSRWWGWRMPVSYRGQHDWQPANLGSFGLDLSTVPFPAAIYVVNHGENTRQRRGKMNGKLGYLARNRIDAEEATRVAADFALGPESSSSRRR